MFGFGFPEVILLVVVVLIVFGAGKLPDVLRSVGSGLREFKQALNPEEYPDAPSIDPENTTETNTPSSTVESEESQSTPSNQQQTQQ